MTLPLIAEPSAAPRWRHFFRHAVEMIVAMVVGMVLLAPIWNAVLTWLGLDQALERPDLAGLVAATDMTVAMTVWMLYRGHGRARIVEMGAAMFVPYLLLIVPYWLGIFPGEHILMGGHALMMPAMAVAMLAHRGKYARHHHRPHAVHPVIGVLGHRAPTWIALAITLDNWHSPFVPPPWALLVLPAGYLFFGAVRGRLRDSRMLALQLAGLALYLVLAVIAANADPSTAALVIAAGWGFHSVWDFAHHRADAVVPRWWSEWCAVFDLVIAVTIVLFW
ncbi:hypothetical protein [Actinopolymorpha alba]|uniref:hypothetical protein n=1 Tax=Actinopolymorpha alba TaxID=533267 RepID=UPI000382A0FC|nr:hypothetical protein [Actinopolymorpha alba]